MMRSMPALHEIDAIQVAAQYASGTLSPVEFAHACLERIGACEPKLNATYRIDREGALRTAHASESRWRAHKPLSALALVPLSPLVYIPSSEGTLSVRFVEPFEVGFAGLSSLVHPLRPFVPAVRCSVAA